MAGPMTDGISEKLTVKNRRVGDGTPGPGRKKGVPNKINADLKSMILGALNKAGGVDYLTEQARESPSAFLALIGKVLPTTLQGTGADGEIEVRMITRRVVDTHPMERDLVAAISSIKTVNG
ncbi:MAG: hypothetical protein WCL10_18680 [Novosphingobium sp.]|uniref:hypothetical protein n=1 Tax=Novosphingobium sp. TaxID=1874826 RepID=UPI003018361A